MAGRAWARVRSTRHVGVPSSIQELKELSFSLKGKTILVTGASGHLGAAVSKGLAQQGAHLLLNGRSPDNVGELVESIRRSGGTADSAVFDIRDEQVVAEFFGQKANQALHAVVNNAYAGCSGSMQTAASQNYRDSYEVVVVAAHNLLKSALPSLRLAASSGGASVINICSMYGMVSPDLRLYDDAKSANPPSYGAAKAALIQWTRYAACEFGAEGIRINSVSPGPFPSDAVTAAEPEFIRRLEEKVPMGRVGRSVEMVGPIVFLASDASSFVNGSNIVVDGGWTCW